MLPLLFLSHSERDVIFGCWIKLNSNLKYLQILHFIDLSRYNLSAFCDVIKCLFKCILLPNGLRYHHHTHTHTHMFISHLVNVFFCASWLPLLHRRSSLCSTCLAASDLCPCFKSPRGEPFNPAHIMQTPQASSSSSPSECFFS